MKALTFLAMAGTLDQPAKAGDLPAFEALLRRHERLVLSTALRLLGNLADAQDASQEVFLRLYRNLGKLDSEGAVAGWLYRVTVNVCHDMHRKGRVSSPVEDAAEVASGNPDPQQCLTEAERRRVLHMSLRKLSEKERAALVLRDLEGLSTEEVARVLGTSDATVRSQVSKARVKVKDYMERYFRRRG